MKGGDGSATRLVFGQSTTETEDGLRRTTNRILAGGSILTVFHEDAHALRREAHARGILSREDDIAIIRAVDAVLNGRIVRRRKGAPDMDASPARLSLLPENFDSLSLADQDVAIDEAISELMEAEIIRTRKGGGARDIPAGIISRNMAAIARLAGPRAAGRFGSFVEAFRSFFGLATDRAHHIKRGLADGSISQAEYDGYFGKLTGRDARPSVETETQERTSIDPAKMRHLVDVENDTSFSTGSDPAFKGSEARIAAATIDAREKVSATDQETVRRTGRFWLSLHGEQGVSQLPELHGKEIGTLLDQVKETYPNLKFYEWWDGDNQAFHFEDGIGEADIFTNGRQVWVTTSRAGGNHVRGGGGHVNRVKAAMSPAVYQIALAYARENGFKFIPDPDGVSALATFRRWPQLLSSAIRLGDTNHIDGHEELGGWRDGDHDYNTGLLALHEYEYVRHFFPEIVHLHLSEDSATIVDHAGAPVSREALRDLLTGERDPRALGVGETTLRRAVVTGQAAADGRMESNPEARSSDSGVRRIHPGAAVDSGSDFGSGNAGTGPGVPALKDIAYSIGPESGHSGQSDEAKVSAEPRIVADDSNYYFTYPKSHLLAEIDSDGTLNFAIEADEGRTYSGGEIFHRMMRHFSGKVKAVAGTWRYGDNLGKVNELTGEGMKLEDAIHKTFTAHMASKYGFTDANIKNAIGSPGAYQLLQVTFSRPK